MKPLYIVCFAVVLGTLLIVLVPAIVNQSLPLAIYGFACTICGLFLMTIAVMIDGEI